MCSRPQCLQFETHTGVLLQLVEEVLGGDEVVQEVAETVVLVGRLQDGKDLDRHECIIGIKRIR